MFSYDESEVSVGDYTLAVTSDDGPWWSIRAVGGSDDIDGGSCESMHAARLAAEAALFERLEVYRPLLCAQTDDRQHTKTAMEHAGEYLSGVADEINALTRPHAPTIREERAEARERVAEKRAARVAQNGGQDAE